MTKLMQTASVLTMVASLAAAPLSATAQDAAESDAEEATEEMVQETEQAADEAVQETEQAVDEVAQEAEEATEEAAQEVEEATDEAAQEVEEATDEAAQEADEATDEMAEEAEVETVPAENVEVIPADEVDAEMAEGEEPVQEVPGAILMQDENSMLASSLMGATVFNSAGESVGDIDDMIISMDGTVNGVVIGVGGFLGIGEKLVAIEMQQITVQMDEDGDPRLLVDTTRESLEAAPEFVTAEEQRDAEEQQEMRENTAPADGGVAPVLPATEGAETPAEEEAPVE